MGRRAILSSLAVLVTCLTSASAASAAPVRYVVDFGSGTNNQLTLDGNEVTSVQINAFGPTCDVKAAAESLSITLPGIVSSSVTATSISLSGDATTPTRADSGVHFDISASVSKNPSVIRGTITLSLVRPPADQECPDVKLPFAAAPEPPGPVARFDWAALRRSVRGQDRYYFLVRHVHCLRGATHVRIAFSALPPRTVRCGVASAYASGPQQPGKTYFVRVMAVKLRRHHVAAHGTSVLTSVRMPQPNEVWTRAPRIPGTPPAI